MDEPTPPKTPAPRTTKGQFVKGASGNPAGRAKGSRNSITLRRLETEEALRNVLAPAAPKLLKRAIEIALTGDPNSMGTIAMLKLLMDKSMSTLRNEDVGESKDTNVQVNISGLTTVNRDRVSGDGETPKAIEARVIPSDPEST